MPVAAVIAPVASTVKVPEPMLKVLPCRAAVVLIALPVLIAPKPVPIEPLVSAPVPVRPL